MIDNHFAPVAALFRKILGYKFKFEIQGVVLNIISSISSSLLVFFIDAPVRQTESPDSPGKSSDPSIDELKAFSKQFTFEERVIMELGELGILDVDVSRYFILKCCFEK